MKILKLSYWFLLIFFVFLSLIVWFTPFTEVLSLPNHIELTQGSVEDFVSSQNSNLISSKFNFEHKSIDYYLCNTFKFKSIEAEIVPERKVLLGGDTIGFEYNTQGVLVVGKNKLMGKDGFFDNLSNNELACGDIITEINGVEVNSASEISQIVNDVGGGLVEVRAIRKGKEYSVKLKPAYDLLTKKYKLGLWTKQKVNGIGTLTYIEKEKQNFGSLGHGVVEPTSNTMIDVLDGEVFDCFVLGIKQATKGVAGELRGMLKMNKSLGTVDKNLSTGVYGKIEDSNFLDGRKEIVVGGKHTIVPGKALIYCSIDGKNVRAYDIEIIKTSYNATKNRDMVIKIIDERLIKTTGGIVQGMSGSPIVQNGKLVGAITHVFVNDPTKGFGIFIDNMLKN